MAEEMIEGTVKFFNSDKGYGFLTRVGGGMDVFVHSQQLRLSGIFRSLTEGEKVRCELGVGERGPFAKKISLVEPDHKTEAVA